MTIGELKELLADWDESLEVVIEIRDDGVEDGDLLVITDDRSLYITLDQLRIIGDLQVD